MAKTAKVKKRQVTVHSRAARRAVSPSVDLDKSITRKATRSTSPADRSTSKPHVLAAQNTGISKKQKGKPVKRAQRLRQLKGMERAADNMDKLELKVQKSVVKEKKVNERKKGWEDVNGDRAARKSKSANAFDALGDDEEVRNEREWVSDDDMPEVEAAPEVASGVKDVVPEIVAVVPEEDELL